MLALSDESSAANEQLEGIESAETSFLTRVQAAALKCATLRQLALSQGGTFLKLKMIENETKEYSEYE